MLMLMMFLQAKVIQRENLIYEWRRKRRLTVLFLRKSRIVKWRGR